ncbi:MAG: hypothetical protein ACLR3R_20000 [Clostridium paraputrificum]
MRVKMRREVNLNDLENKPVEISELKPIERIAVGFRMWGRNSSIYKALNEKNSNAAMKKRMMLIDNVKEVLLLKLNKELKGKSVVEFNISRIYLDIIDDVFSSSEFLSFKITRIPENSDILLSFTDMPMRFRFEVV